MNLSADFLQGAATALKCELAAEVLRSSGNLRLRVSGWSMLPIVRPGDLLIVEPANSGVFPGAIVLFSLNQRLLAHRLVAASGDGSSVITQGDAMPRPDPTVEPSDVLGRVTWIVRKGRYIEVKPTIGVPQRAVAALVRLIRRSDLASAIAVGLHRMRQSLKESTHQCQS